MKIFHRYVWIIGLLLLVFGCQEKEVLITGKTMGTTYHIKVITSQKTEVLEQKIEKRLQEINRSMSTYDKSSEISRLNAIQDTDQPFRISNDFMQVMIVAEDLFKLTQGAWDGTVKPLVNLWGFGKSASEPHVPSSDEIGTVLEQIGFNHVEISEEGYLRKRKPMITIDLASIAKGYGVDQIAELIEKEGVKNFLVEIGGEVYASGKKKEGKLWKVGINTPLKDASLNDVYKAVSIEDNAFATSGDYRNFFELDGKRYSHVIDPKTGYPVSNGVVSTSVIADNCTFADGLATALMVMGHEKGIELVDRLEDVECMIIVQQGDGTLKDYVSKGFRIDN